jgi:hypothetical protein
MITINRTAIVVMPRQPFLDVRVQLDGWHRVPGRG